MELNGSSMRDHYQMNNSKVLYLSQIRKWQLWISLCRLLGDQMLLICSPRKERWGMMSIKDPRSLCLKRGCSRMRRLWCFGRARGYWWRDSKCVTAAQITTPILTNISKTQKTTPIGIIGRIQIAIIRPQIDPWALNQTLKLCIFTGRRPRWGG